MLLLKIGLIRLVSLHRMGLTYEGWGFLIVWSLEFDFEVFLGWLDCGHL